MIDSNFINEWLPKEEIKDGLFAAPEKIENKVSIENKVNSHVSEKVIHDIEIVTKRIEEAQIDITPTYQSWVKVGLSLANELGEEGRLYFHRVSSKYPRYSRSECDKQYDVSIRDNGKGATIKSFFYLAEQAGIDIKCEDSTPAVVFTETSDTQMLEKLSKGIESENQENAPLIFNTPNLPDEIFANIPMILRESCTLFREGIERDIFLVSAIGVLSACLPNIGGYYFNKTVSSHIYLFITGPSAAGKGGLDWAKYLIQPIHDQYMEQSLKDRDAYEIEVERYETLPRAIKQNTPKPSAPPQKKFIIPGNVSASSLIESLVENNGRGIIFETEADTMANAAKQDWGNSDDAFRKAFHGETISLSRRKDKEYLEIKNPHLAIVMSGTPKQVLNIMPEVENGLFSRFLYYAFEDMGGFNSPFESHAQENYPEYFSKRGKEILVLYGKLQTLAQPIIFQFTKEQEHRFTASFSHMLEKDRLIIGSDFVPNVKRMGLITFRIAMILTSLRLLERPELVAGCNNQLICSDLDFGTALTLVTTLEKHAIAVFHRMPKSELKGKMAAFYDNLPQQFDRQGYLKAATELGIKEKMAEYYISKLVPKLLNHEFNQYTKITN